jgi:hypothetical protein
MTLWPPAITSTPGLSRADEGSEAHHFTGVNFVRAGVVGVAGGESASIAP